MASFANVRWAIVQAITNRNPNRSLVYGDLVFKRAGRCIMNNVAGHPVTQHAWTRAGIRFDGQRRWWHCCRACWEFAVRLDDAIRDGSSEPSKEAKAQGCVSAPDEG